MTSRTGIITLWDTEKLTSLPTLQHVNPQHHDINCLETNTRCLYSEADAAGRRIGHIGGLMEWFASAAVTFCLLSSQRKWQIKCDIAVKRRHMAAVSLPLHWVSQRSRSIVLAPLCYAPRPRHHSGKTFVIGRKSFWQVIPAARCLSLSGQSGQATRALFGKIDCEPDTTDRFLSVFFGGRVGEVHKLFLWLEESKRAVNHCR